MPRSSKIVIYLEVDGERLPMYFTRLEKAMNRIGKSVVKSARSVLKKQGKVVTGNLSKSLFYVIEGSKDTIELTFEGSVPYWDFVEQGVQGANPGKPIQIWVREEAGNVGNAPRGHRQMGHPKTIWPDPRRKGKVHSSEEFGSSGERKHIQLWTHSK